jgi:hypothetical protein
MNAEIPKQMQVVEISAPGGPEALRIATQPVRQSGRSADQVAAVVLIVDVLQRMGVIRCPPAQASAWPESRARSQQRAAAK